MKTKLPLPATLVVFLILSILSILAVEVTSPKIKLFRKQAVIGNYSLAGEEYTLGLKKLNKKLSDPIFLNLDSKSQAISFKDLGITINKTDLEKFTKTCRSKPFKMFCTNNYTNVPNAKSLIKIDESKLNAFLDSFEGDLQYLAKNNIISFDDYSFRALSPDAKITLNKEMFTTKESLLSLFNEGIVSVSLKTAADDNLSQQKAVTENLAKKISVPLLIKYGRNPVHIPAQNMESFLEIKEKEGHYFGFVNAKQISMYIKKLGESYEDEDVKVVEDRAVEAIQRAILYRAANFEINNAVVLPLQGKPHSTGELHDVYLEVIKSQQRLYRFENGELVKTYIISTGLTWETPPGKYQVLGKQKMTISYFDDWFMPNYLPLGTINGYNFGFHAIPYHVDASGKIYSRDSNTMGSPATGGCIQLTQEESLELFDWAKVGTPVYIYE